LVTYQKKHANSLDIAYLGFEQWGPQGLLLGLPWSLAPSDFNIWRSINISEYAKSSGNGTITQTMATCLCNCVVCFYHGKNKRRMPKDSPMFCLYLKSTFAALYWVWRQTPVVTSYWQWHKSCWLTDCSQLRFRGGGVTVNRLHAQITIIGVIVKYSSRANPAMYSEFKTLEGQ